LGACRACRTINIPHSNSIRNHKETYKDSGNIKRQALKIPFIFKVLLKSNLMSQQPPPDPEQAEAFAAAADALITRLAREMAGGAVSEETQSMLMGLMGS
jgi:hypothetical protein